jgi:aminoglycoside phosphotransferase (APT) family kinase protein
MVEPTPLPQGHGGSELWRSDRGVHRTSGPWTPTVHAFLEHLHANGFAGAPVPLGLDADGREVLTYIDGEVLADPAWRPGTPTPWPAWAQSEDALVAAARLLRDLHAASAGFAPEAPTWKQYEHRALLADEVVCHGDVGPHNTVYRDGLPVALIDWETIRPNHPLVELGIALWHYVPLGDDDYFAASGFGATPDLPHRVARFTDAYGCHDPAAVSWALQQAKQRSTDAMRYWPISAAQGAAYLRIVANDLAWLDARLADLVRDVGAR